MVEWIKSHPYLVGASVVGLFILYLIGRNASGASAAPSGSGTYGPSDNLQAAQLAAAEQMQQYQLSAMVASGQTEASTRQTELNTSAATQQAYYQRQVELQSILTSGANTSEQIRAALQLGLAQTGAPLALAGVTGQVTPTPGGGVLYGAAQAGAAVQQQQQQQQQQITTAVNQTPAALQTIYTPPAATAPAGVAASPAHTGTQTWDQYFGGVVAADPRTQGYYFDPSRVAAQVSDWAAAQTSWITDPLSCHNRDCSVAA